MKQQHDTKINYVGDFAAAVALLGLSMASILIAFAVAVYIDRKNNYVDMREFECKTAFINEKQERECVVYRKKGVDLDGYGNYRHRKYDSEQGTLLLPRK